MKKILERLFPSLGKKIAFAVSLVLLIGGGTFVFFAHRTGYTMLEQQAHVKARGTAELMKGIIDHAMLEGQRDHLKHALHEATNSPIVLNAYILRGDGTVLLSAKPDSSAQRLPLEQFSNIAGMDGERFLSTRERDSLFEYIITPIVKKPTCYRCHKEAELVQGYFGLKLGMDDLRSLASGHRTTNLIVTILTFTGLGGIILVALSILVVQPIGKLHSHIRKIESDVSNMNIGDQSNFPLLAEPQGKDEIADLCRDFNNLVRRLNDANAKIYEMHQAELEHADRLASTGQMAAGMAHEIKNPIAGVLGALQVFDGEMLETDPRKEIITEMMVQLERVNHAVNDLLSYARPMPPVLEKVRVDDLIKKTTTLLSQQVKGKTISILTSHVEDSLVIYADKKQIQQVLWNILLNAVQSIDGQGTVSISTSQNHSSACIRVTDNGKGIPLEKLKSVFVPFFTTKSKGTGLGMTICKRIIEQHGGTIVIASEVGKGTTASFSIPLADTRL